MAPQPSKPVHRGGTETDPGYAPPQLQPRYGEAVAARLHLPPGEPVPCNEKSGTVPIQREKTAYRPKPYQQMTYPGQRIQVDVKVLFRRCIADPELRLYQYSAFIPLMTSPGNSLFTTAALTIFL